MLGMKKRMILVCLMSGFFILLQLFVPQPQSAGAAYSRLAGSDRYQTAVAISQKGWNKSDYVVLVKGDEFADALCAGPLAKKYNAPILFTEKYSINASILQEIRRLGVVNVIIVGGYGAISGYVEQNLNSAGITNIERIYGSSRYGTSVEIAKRLGSKEVALTTANQYADALSISAVAAAKGFPILLTSPDELPDEVKMHLKNYKIERTYLIGGTKVIGKEIESQVPSPIRLAGIDRYDTNRLILEKFSTDLDFNKIYCAIGEGESGYADSLAGVVLASKTSSPIVLNGKTLSPATQDYIQSKMTVASYIIVLGGEVAVSYDVLNDYSESLDKVVKSVFNQKGTYGPASGTSTISGSLAIEAPDIKVQNTVIEGDLLLGEGIGSGTVELSNVTVKGRTTIRGGGQDSIIGNDFTSKSMVIDVPSEKKVAIHLARKSAVENVQIQTNAILDDAGSTSTGFTDVNIFRGDAVTLKGTYNAVSVNSNGISLDLATATIKTLNAKSSQTISGTGTISSATISSNGVEILFSPTLTIVEKGYRAYVAGQWLSEGSTKGSAVTTPISNLSGTAGDGQATFSFSAPTGATGVILKQSSNGGTTWINSTTASLSASSTTATATGLTNGQVYSFKLVISGGSKAGDSNIVLLTPVGTPITDLAGTIGDKQASFAFSAATGATSVTLQQSIDGGTTWLNSMTSLLSSSSTTAVATGLTNGQAYRFRLVVGGGSRAGDSNVIILTPLGAITDLAGTSGDREVSLTFSVLTGATSASLQQSTDGGSTWTNSSVLVALNSSSTSATATGLINGLEYKFKLVVTGGARGGDSNICTVTPNI